MKISALCLDNYRRFYNHPDKQQISARNSGNYGYNISCPAPATPNLNFGIANAGKLRILFGYNLPCMYTGVDMIDPQRVQRLMKSKVFEKGAGEALKAMLPFEKSITDTELEVYKEIKAEAEGMPDKTLQEVLRSLVPENKEQLRKKQKRVFEELMDEAQSLPESFNCKFKEFMENTDDKLNDRPVFIPFSSFQFIYELGKIRDDILKHKGKKERKIINKMVKETPRLCRETNRYTIDTQKKVINYLDIISQISVLKDYSPLKSLLDISKERLDGKKIKVPFSRKSFIYDLTNITKDIPDTALQKRLLAIACKLPASREDKSAYILKYASEPPEKIAYRLLWPNFASVEHILPKSCGGVDEMRNYGGAGTRENSERGNIDFVSQIKRKPDTPINCQKYIDRLIELVKKGIFKKHNIDTKYIKDFKGTVREQSDNSIILDTSALESK